MSAVAAYPVPSDQSAASRPVRFLTPPSMSSGRCLTPAPPSRPLSRTPPPPTQRTLLHSAFHSSSSTQQPHWSGRPLSTPFSSLSAPDMSASPYRSANSASSLSPPALTALPSPAGLLVKRSSSASAAAASSGPAISARSYALCAALLVFSLALSLLFIVHLSAHAEPLSDGGSALLAPSSGGAVGLIAVAPNSLHGPASSLQPQLLFSRSVAARQLESFADRKRRKEAMAVEEQVEQDMRRMHKLSDALKADWQAKQRNQPATAPPAVATAAALAVAADSVSASVRSREQKAVKSAEMSTVGPVTGKKAAVQKAAATQLRGGAAKKMLRETLSVAPV